MKWRVIDQNNVPDGEVLAVDNHFTFLVGTLYSDGTDTIVCESDGVEMDTVVYYIPISEIERDLESFIKEKASD